MLTGLCLCLLYSEINTQLLCIVDVEQHIVVHPPLCQTVYFLLMWTRLFVIRPMMVVSSAYFAVVIGVHCKQEGTGHPALGGSCVWLTIWTEWGLFVSPDSDSVSPDSDCRVRESRQECLVFHSVSWGRWCWMLWRGPTAFQCRLGFEGVWRLRQWRWPLLLMCWP